MGVYVVPYSDPRFNITLVINEFEQELFVLIQMVILGERTQVIWPSLPCFPYFTERQA